MLPVVAGPAEAGPGLPTRVGSRTGVSGLGYKFLRPRHSADAPEIRSQPGLDLREGCGEFLGVNIITSARIISGLALCVLIGGCATNSEVTSLGGDMYSVKRTATTAFERDTDKLSSMAKDDAARFCAAHGKQLKVVDVVVDKPFYTTGYASAKVVFKALNPGEVDQPAQPVPAVQAAAPQSQAPAVVSQKQATDDLYTELTKLDELRKKGILTEEEFQAQKKKLLNSSN